ncbi:MAG: hypothetical protein H6811_08110 [Phycisphaeraceae bacterium]|nr:hypothetical protein [Phycisphaeraceae bacterium]
MSRALRGVVLFLIGAAGVAGLMLLPPARQVASGAIGERMWWSLSGSSLDPPRDAAPGESGPGEEGAARPAPDLWEVQWLIASFHGPLGAWVEVEEVWQRRSRLTPIDMDRPRLSAGERRAIAARVWETQSRQVESAAGGQADLVRIAIEDGTGRVVRVSWLGWARIVAASAIVGGVATVLVAGALRRRAGVPERDAPEEEDGGVAAMGRQGEW